MNDLPKTHYVNPTIYKIVVYFSIVSGMLFCLLFKHPVDHTPNVTIPDDTPTVTVSFLYVGEADCILVKTPSGKSVMIDTGYANRQPDVLNHIESLGTFHLDCMILTHPHEDHIQLASGIFDYMPVSRLIIPNIPTTEAMATVLEKAKEKKIPIEVCHRGQSFTMDEVEFFFLADGSEMPNNENSSAMLRVKYKEKVFLLAGDAEKAQETELLDTSLSVKADVLKVGHHGSDSSSSDAFLNKVRPDYAIISVGKDNPFLHPRFEVIDRLNQYCHMVLRTDQNGWINIITDGKVIKVFSEK